MSTNQYLFSYASPSRNLTAMHFQTVNPYAALVATAGPEHDGRSSSSSSPPSSGSSTSFTADKEVAALPATPSRSQAQAYGISNIPQQHISHGSPEQRRFTSLSVNSTPRRVNHAARPVDQSADRTGSRAPNRSASNAVSQSQTAQVSSLAGVPESVAVQEMAFRQGQRNSVSSVDEVPANPFAIQHDRLWAAFYKLGKECGGQPTPVPNDTTYPNFTWPVLINPYTQSLEHPNGSVDPAWTGRMIQIALNCMEELIRVTCRRNTGWDKIVADVPLPAQEAMVFFPDLASRYEILKRDAMEARAGGRPYGY